MRIKLAALIAAGAVVLAGCSSQSADGGAADGGAEAISQLSIIVPADPGGGWDQTGRAISQVLTTDKLVSSAPVTNIPGAGGTVGLASLATETNPNTLMMTGLVMVGAVETNKAENRIEDTTPIARLTEEALVIVVPAESPYQSLTDLVDDIKANGQAVSITGGSAGGADHILAGLVLGAAGMSKDDIAANLNYIPNSGGGEAVTLLLGNKVSAGISGVGEFLEHVNAGKLRALAVSAPEPVAALPDVSTIIDAGFDVSLTNWRGVLAPGGITAEQRQALIDLVTQLNSSAAWTSTLETNGWSNAFLAGDEFDSFLEGNIADVGKTLGDIGLL